MVLDLNQLIRDTQMQYYICFGFAQACGLISVILVIYVLEHFKSISWKIEHRFTLHPFLMVLGLVYLQGTSISAFRALNRFNRQNVKYFHAAVHTIVFILTVIALCAIFDTFNAIKKPHLVSFHGWLGLFTVILFTAQWFYSCLAFMVPIFSEETKNTLMPYHRACGLLTFILSVFNSLVALNGYNLPTESHAMDVCLPMLVLIFALVTVIIVMLKKFKRENIYD